MAFFSFLDVCIFWAYLALILGVGIYASRSVKNITDYSLGGAKYSAFFVFATLSAAFIGGGFTVGLSESVFQNGLIYVVALWGFSVKEILVATVIAPRMSQFKGSLSVGDIMGKLYGRQAKVFTGIAGSLVCAGIEGAQFSAFGYMAHILIGIPAWVGILVGSLVVIFYSTLGGMKSVVINDTIHFCVLIVALPLVLIFGINAVGGFETLFTSLPEPHQDLWGSIPPLTLLALFLSFFFGETLVPPYVQRLLIGKTFKDTAKGTLASGLLSIPFFLMVGIIGLIALHLAPMLNPNLSLPYVIQTVMPLGLKGLAIAGIMAVLMSSADAFLNAASVSAIHDGLKGLRNKDLTPEIELKLTRLATLAMGIAGALFALRSASVIDVLLYAYNFWTPFILVPLVAGILGYHSTPKTFWISSFSGIIGMLTWKLTMGATGSFDAAIAGIGFNFVTFVLLRMRENSLYSRALLRGTNPN